MFKNYQDINLGFNKKKEKELKNVYIIYKIKKNPIEHSESYKQLKDFIKSINNDKKENLLENEIKIEKEGKKIEYEICLENNDKQKAKFSLINKNGNLLI